MKRSFTVAVSSLILSAVLLIVSSCTYVTPEAENPNPGLENASTMYQVKDGILSLRKEVIGYEISQEKNTVKNLRKTWLCGWAPIVQSGGWHGAGGLSNTPYKTRHCNMEMRISKDGTNLEARLINLNFPTDYDRWQLLFTIPILEHFYYEKDVDSRGRELNKYLKVTDRKNWQVRPIMDLDIKGIKIEDMSKRIGVSNGSSSAKLAQLLGASLSDVYDLEVSKENERQYIAFSATVVDPSWGSHIQHVYRFNFLEIKENPTFKVTPYNTRNAKHMNILHILGYQPDGLNEVNYAAHWDVSKPVEFCLNGFPDDSRNYRKIGEDVIAEMNKAMVKIGAVKKGQTAFVVSKKQPKYHFDLRCPSISWVDDPHLSFRAPLGIGLVNTNIKTGEILWGGAVIWGGLIDYIVNRDSESVADALTRYTHEMLSSQESSKESPYFEDIRSHIKMPYESELRSLRDIISSRNSFAGISEMLQIAEERKMELQAQSNGPMSEEQKDEAFQTERTIKTLQNMLNDERIKELEKDGGLHFSTTDRDVIAGADNKVSQAMLQEAILSNSNLGPNIPYEGHEKELKSIADSAGMSTEKAKELIKSQLSNQDKPFDFDNRVENHYYAMTTQLSNMSGLEKLEAAKSMIKNVTLHELGHVVGLGHQFEGNRMPEKGMVPDRVYNELAEDVPARHNYSSIMDYQSGHTEVSLPYNKVKMQEQDLLTLTYLYKQQYSTYKSGDLDWTFEDVPANGVIPNQNPNNEEYKTRYMPQCSDIDAWLATSPYCRRWDRGHDAPTIVEENLKEYTDSFISRMNSFSEATGGNPYFAKYRLWRTTYNLMNYNRTFYDNMRYSLSNNDVYRNVFDKMKKDESALLAFSKACVDPSLAPDDDWGVEFTKLAIQPLYSDIGVTTLEELQERQTPSSYESMYNKYKNIISGYKLKKEGEEINEEVATAKNTLEMSDVEFDSLEQELNDNGLAFSELQKLCRASKKSLEVAKLLLNLKGPDHATMNYDSAIVPTGLRGGQATSDWSRAFGTYDQLGLLPVKLAALDVLTRTSSTLRFWYWDIGKPIYNDSNEGKYGYFSMYPEEFTDVIGTAVKNNMGFGGTQLQDAASMSVSNLYLSYFLYRTFSWSNDGQVRGFNSNYLDDIKAQSQFRVGADSIVAVLLESIDIPGQPTNKRFGFRPKLFNLAKRTLTDLPEAFALPDRKVIVRGNESQIILPLSKMRFLGQDAAYVWALEVTYDKTSYDDPLQGFTVKNAISELTTQELDKCIGGEAGLATYFNSNEEFEGFDIGPNIATDPDAQTNFERSLNNAFVKYQNREGVKPKQIGCEESVKGVGLVTSTALSINGFFLPQVLEYIKK